MNQEIRTQYLAEQTKRWNGKKSMIDYCMKQAQIVVRTSKGYLIALDRPSIKKQFCFGESGYDFQDALDMANHARTSVDYFMEENLEEIDSTIKRLQDYNLPAYAHKGYTGSDIICSLAILRPCDTYNYPWKFELDNGRLDELTIKDRELLVEAYQTLRKAFVKRLETYLKKYGLSKVHAWTYWRDA